MGNNSALIGYTGFVGGNIVLQNDFEFKYNSKNIYEIENKNFDSVICAGVSSKKWWANENPNIDKAKIDELTKIIQSIKCNRFILISTIDVYNIPINVNENTKININQLDPYGKNRYYFEEFIQSKFNNTLILRLPALYGKGLKKNFIYDLLNPLPQTIKREKYLQIINDINDKTYYILKLIYSEDFNGNYTLNNNIDHNYKSELIDYLKEINFTSSVFTDYRSYYQFYDLKNLYKDINKAIEYKIKLLNIAVEPVQAFDIAKNCFYTEFSNTIEGKNPVKYDFRSIYSELWGKGEGYLYTKSDVYEGIKAFVKESI